MDRVQRRLAWIGGAISPCSQPAPSASCSSSGYRVFDAFYMTLITITTVGYGEIPRRSAMPAGSSTRS